MRRAFPCLCTALISLCARLPAQGDGPVALPNADFEAEGAGRRIPSWGGGGEGYEIGLDDVLPHTGKQCVRIHWAGEGAAKLGFGTLTRGLPAAPYIGRRLRLSAFVRSEAVEGTAGVWLRVDGEDGTLAFDNMQSRGIRGTTPWQRHEVVLDVAEGARNLVFGVLLSGAGTIWIDDVVLEPVGTDVAVTATDDTRSEGVPGLFELRGAHALHPSGRGGAKSPRMLLPLPISYREQVPLTWCLTVEPAAAATGIRVYEDRPGNFVAEVELGALGDDDVQVEWQAVVLCGPPSGAAPESAPYPRNWPEEARPWLRSTRYAQANDDRIAAVAKEIRGDRDDVMAVIAATLERTRSIFAKQAGHCRELDAVEALDRQGSCTSCANLVAALLRANGVPARILAGYPSWSGPLQTHYNVEAFVPEHGWYRIESTLLRAPWPPAGQVQVAIVPPEYEDRGGPRMFAAGGVPYLSLTEYVDLDGQFTARGTVNAERYCDHVATQLVRFEQASDADWQHVLELGRERWSRWLAGEPRAGAGGRLAAPLPAAAVREAKDPQQLAARLQAAR